MKAINIEYCVLRSNLLFPKVVLGDGRVEIVLKSRDRILLFFVKVDLYVFLGGFTFLPRVEDQ